MLKRALNFAMTRAQWHRQAQDLVHVTTMEQFEGFVTRTQPKEFLRYRAMSDRKRTEFRSVVDALGISLQGMRFLDIGPAYGDALDICHEGGAEHIAFIEVDPVFFTYNTLKPYANGFRLNHLLGFRTLRPQQYDLIWVKGSIKADSFMLLDKANRFMSRWLSGLEQLASPSCRILICPYWGDDGGRRNGDDVRSSPFSAVMRSCGYSALPPIQHHNDVEYPITFHKDMRQAADRAAALAPARPPTPGSALPWPEPGR
ncbi:hypothetical protein [Azospirillum sp. sgz301742]